MARGLNKVQIIGNLGADPELRYTGTGTAVCNMRVAVNESYKDQDGNMVEKVEWISVVTWARLAEICGEYLKRGSQVYFEGSLQTRSWEDQEGNTRYTTEVKAKEMMMLGGRGNGDEEPRQRQQPKQQQKQKPQQQRRQPQRRQEDDDPFSLDDDLPF